MPHLCLDVESVGRHGADRPLPGGADPRGARRLIDAELRRALDRGEFRLHFQPVLAAATGRAAGAGALLRWQHPTRGLLGADAFLPAAERSGLIRPIGEWVVAEAIAERATWPAGTFVSINLSPTELASAGQRDLVGQVARACGRAGVDPAEVWVEVTEQPITEFGRTVTTLRGLADLGVKVVLDDFGSGSASLGRLHALPFDVCKLDRSVVTGMTGHGGIAMVRSVLALLRTVGMVAVAEGVETAHELRQLGALGCELNQGFLLSRPVTADAVRALLIGQARAAGPEERSSLAQVRRQREFRAFLDLRALPEHDRRASRPGQGRRAVDALRSG